MRGQGEADRVLIARGFWDDVAIGEPLGDLECAGEASAATGQGERFNRQVAALGRDLPQALAVFQRLRLDAQLDALDQGQVPDNFVVAERLRRLDRELLRDALRVAKDFRQHVRLAFHLTD